MIEWLLMADYKTTPAVREVAMTIDYPEVWRGGRILQ